MCMEIHIHIWIQLKLHKSDTWIQRSYLNSFSFGGSVKVFIKKNLCFYKHSNCTRRGCRWGSCIWTPDCWLEVSMHPEGAATGRRIGGMIRLRPEQVWTCSVTLHVHTCSGRNRIIPLMRRPNTDSTPNKPVTLPRNRFLIRYAVASSVHSHDTVLRYAVTLQVCARSKNGWSCISTPPIGFHVVHRNSVTLLMYFLKPAGIMFARSVSSSKKLLHLLYKY